MMTKELALATSTLVALAIGCAANPSDRAEAPSEMPENVNVDGIPGEELAERSDVGEVGADWATDTLVVADGDFADARIEETVEPILEIDATPVEVEGTIKTLATSVECNDVCSPGQVIYCPDGSDFAGATAWLCQQVTHKASDTGEVCLIWDWVYKGGCNIADLDLKASVTDNAKGRKWYGRAKRASNGHTLYAQKSGKTWGAWIDLGGVTTDAPRLAVGRSGWMQIFVRGTNGHVYRRTQTSTSASGWSKGWEDLGGAIKGAPTAMSNKDGRMEVWARSSANHLVAKFQNSRGGWGSWISYGGVLASPPRLSLNDNQRLEVHALGTAHDSWFLRQTSPGTWSSAWNNLGGNHVRQRLTGKGRLRGVLGDGALTQQRFQTSAGTWGPASWVTLPGSL